MELLINGEHTSDKLIIYTVYFKQERHHRQGNSTGLDATFVKSIINQIKH